MAVVLLFSLAMFTFATEFITINNPSSTFSNRSDVNEIVTDINSTITIFKQSGDSWQQDLSGSKPLPVELVFLIFDGAFYIPQAMLSLGVQSISVFTKMFYLGLSASPAFSMIFIVFNFAIGVAIVLLIIKAIRSGETER
jgi:hypothetical protein